MSVSKCCCVINLVCGMDVVDVVIMLKFQLQVVVELICKVIVLVMVNVEQIEGLCVDDLYILQVFVDEGIIMCCICFCVKGFVSWILKCFVYIIVVVEFKEVCQVCKKVKLGCLVVVVKFEIEKGV